MKELVSGVVKNNRRAYFFLGLKLFVLCLVSLFFAVMSWTNLFDQLRLAYVFYVFCFFQSVLSLYLKWKASRPTTANPFKSRISMAEIARNNPINVREYFHELQIRTIKWTILVELLVLAITLGIAYISFGVPSEGMKLFLAESGIAVLQNAAIIIFASGAAIMTRLWFFKKELRTENSLAFKGFRLIFGLASALVFAYMLVITVGVLGLAISITI